MGGESEEHHVGQNKANQCERSQNNEGDRDRVTDILSPVKKPYNFIIFTFRDDSNKGEGVNQQT